MNKENQVVKQKIEENFTKVYMYLAAIDAKYPITDKKYIKMKKDIAKLERSINKLLADD